MKSHSIEVWEGYWLGEHFSNAGWDRLTLFRQRKNSSGGSINWPIAVVDVVDHPPMEGSKRHTAIRISIRNDIKSTRSGIEIDKNKTQLRHPEDILDTKILREVVNKLQDIGIASKPLSVLVCMTHVEDFRVEGDVWVED